MFPIFLFGVWLLSIFLAVLEKKVKGMPGGVSIFPVFPIMPLAAWGLAVLLELVYHRLGYYIIGGLHVILLILWLILSVKYLYQLMREPKK